MEDSVCLGADSQPVNKTNSEGFSDSINIFSLPFNKNININISGTMSYFNMSQSIAQNYIDAIEDGWNQSFYDSESGYTINFNVDLDLVGGTGGDLILIFDDDEWDSYAGKADLGGRDIYYGVAGSGAAAHEFAHILGIDHFSNGGLIDASGFELTP